MITGIIKDKVSIISAMLKAEANKTYQDLNYLGYHKNCLIIHCFEKKIANTLLQGTELMFLEITRAQLND